MTFEEWGKVLHNAEHVGMIDITAPEKEVAIQVSNDGKAIWIHVDGITVMRICRIPKLEILNPSPVKARK